MVVGRRSFPFGLAYFQGQTVKLRGCIPFISVWFLFHKYGSFITIYVVWFRPKHLHLTYVRKLPKIFSDIFWQRSFDGLLLRKIESQHVPWIIVVGRRSFPFEIGPFWGTCWFSGVYFLGLTISSLKFIFVFVHEIPMVFLWEKLCGDRNCLWMSYVPCSSR